MSRRNWPAIKPCVIANECSRAHIYHLLIDAQADIADLTAQLAEARAALADRSAAHA